jgi:glycosyltransferase involved in cell wall biosynthesis
LLVEAFINAFGNNPDVALVINSRFCHPTVGKQIQDKIKKKKITNVHLNIKCLSWKDYIQFMQSIDCYVSFSKGEGYAIIPREALALGIPVILSDNTAHTSLCDTGFVKAVPSLVKESIDYDYFRHQNCYFSNCMLTDATEALRDVHNNYADYLQKAHAGREWVKQFSHLQLKRKYLNLVKPAKVLYGNKNEITDEYLMTSSLQLFKKYKMILRKAKSK